ncbi:MAG: S-layer homology domain-containing protein [Chloroflexia bacterium]
MSTVELRSTSRVSAFSVLAALAAVFVLLGVRSPSAGASQPDGAQKPNSLAPAATCGLAWSRVSSPNVGPSASVLQSVSAASANDVWAVGHYGFSGALTLVEHWDGSAWSVVPSPNIGTEQNYLYGVSALSMTDTWAVGTARGQTLTEHWDGSAWSIVPSPGPVDNSYDTLFAVTAISANDVWAVGSRFQSAAYHSLALHWDGSTWTTVPVPDVSAGPNQLTGITAVSSTDVWAVGRVGPYFGEGARTLAVHWNGSAWSIVPTANVGAQDNALLAVDAVSTNDIWAVGNYLSGASWQTLIERWDGTRWNVIPSPNPGTGANYLYGLTGVAAISANDVWAVGNYFDACTPVQTLIEHWDGSAWSVVSSPNIDPRPTLLHSVTTLGPGDAWAVGEYEDANVGWPQTLIEHYTTPVLRFSDVCPSDYFYQATTYLADQHVISGYGDGTFRPANTTTRAQASKIMVLAWNKPVYVPPTPTFRDVPADDPFYTYIETVNHWLIATGYADGTFHPTDSVTRGQLAKMVVKAALWELLMPTTPTFSDVPADHPFYRYIETVYAHCALSGYADHTFRPNNTATRGQVAKMVYKALLNYQPRVGR